MSIIIINLFDCMQFNETIFSKLGFSLGECHIHAFPDGESLVRFNTEVNNKTLLIVADISFPNPKILPLLFVAQTARSLGAKEIHLFTPYLPYMRQDKQFHPGEGITSTYFAKLLSNYVDSLVTIEPHLHRWHALSDIYTIPATAIQLHHLIAQWLQNNIKQPVLIGPDRESEKWVSAIAKIANLPYVIFDKVRHNDKEVTINLPSLTAYENDTAVIIDDVISTGQTMMKVVGALQDKKIVNINCLAVHALFIDDAYQELINMGVQRVITCNTVKHASNRINISDALLSYFSKMNKAI